jgi:PrsW family intramembrane metalloprotease/Response regulator receiver domain
MSEAGQFLFDPTALFNSIDPHIIFYAGLLCLVALFIRKFGLQTLCPSNMTGDYWTGLVITSILSIIAVLVIQEIAIYYVTVVLSVDPSTVLRTGVYAVQDFHGKSELFPIAIAVMLFLIGGGYAYSNFDVSLPVHIFTFIVSVGFVEEMSKAFAGVALCLFMFSLPLRMGRGAIISAFGIAGLGFGIGEAFHYYAIYQQGGAGLDAYLIRCLWCVPLHFCWTIITGSLVASRLSEVFAKNNTKFRYLFWILFCAAIPSIVLHGLYDAFCTHDNPYSWCVGLVSIAWAFIALRTITVATSNKVEPINAHANNGALPTSANQVRSIKIIHIDDEDWVFKMFEEAIQANPKFKNVTVQPFQNRDEAWQELLKRSPDLLITDMYNDNVLGRTQNSGMSGWEMLPRLAIRKVKYPILVVSKAAKEKDVRECAGSELNISFLQKPFTLEQFYGELYKHLSQKIEFSEIHEH